MTETWLTDWQTAFKHMDKRRQTCTYTHSNKHTHAHVHTRLQTKRKNPLLLAAVNFNQSIFIRSEGAFIREMRQGHLWVKASITAFISPLQQRKTEIRGKRERERRPKGNSFCLITATHSHPK